MRHKSPAQSALRMVMLVTARLFISEHTSKAVFKVGQQMVDRAAPRYSPPSLRGAADDPSLRNQLQELFLSEHADRQAVKGALKSRGNSCNTANTPQRKTTVVAAVAAAAVIYLFSIYLLLYAMFNPHHLPDIQPITKKINCSTPALCSLVSGVGYGLFASDTF